MRYIKINNKNNVKKDPDRPINYCKRNKTHYRDCKSKRRYQDYNQAAKFSKKVGLRVYYCRYCDGYHLSSRSKKNMMHYT